MTSLPATQPAANQTAPTPFSEPWLGGLRRMLGSRNGKPALMGGRRLTAAERRKIEGHISNLYLWLAPATAGDKAVTASLARLVAAFPQQGQENVSADLRIDAYYAALAGLPAWTVVTAVNDILAGKTAYGRPWGPWPVELGDECRKLLKPVSDDLRGLQGLLAAEQEWEPSPEERKRVEEGFQHLRASFGGRTAHEVYEDAMAGLRRRADANGVDFDAAMAKIKDRAD